MWSSPECRRLVSDSLCCVWSSPLSRAEPALKCPLCVYYLQPRMQLCEAAVVTAAAAAAGGGVNWYNRLPVLWAWGQSRACKKKIIAGSGMFWCVLQHVRWHLDVGIRMIKCGDVDICFSISNTWITLNSGSLNQHLIHLFTSLILQ